MAAGRDTTRDGLANRIESWLTTHLRLVWWLVERIEPLRRWINHYLVNKAVLKVPPRPNPFSTRHPYTSWESLTDKTFSGRHLEADPGRGDLPDPATVTDRLFMRPVDEDGVERTEPCPKSTVLFPSFAQWFTDGFLRSDRSEPPDPRRNESNHEIDLIQIYGLNPEITELLREHDGGRLRSQMIDGAEFPPYLFEDGRRKPEFRGPESGPGSRGVEVVRLEQVPDERLDQLFALGSDTGNLQVGFVMMSTLFLREHNRIAGRLAEANPGWDDERLFQTARNILIVILIKIVIEEYINHITPYHLRFRTDPRSFGDTERWYRPNWMAVEFNLLYQWHSLPPSNFRLDGRDVPLEQTLFNTETVTEAGLAQLFDDGSRQPAGRIGLFNTSRRGNLWTAVKVAIERGRAVDLASYNDYRAYCGFPRVTDFDQISGDPAVRSALADVYDSVDRIEFYPGLFAEDVRPNSVLPPLIGRFVGIDAFSQALTNPLLAPRVFNERTFTPLGMHLIETTNSLADLVARNVAGGEDSLVTMTRTDWERT